MAGDKCVDVRVRIEPDLKDKAQEILRAQGWTLSAAMRVFLRAVVAHDGIPMVMFPVKTPTPNPITIEAIKESRGRRPVGSRGTNGLLADLENARRKLEEQIGEIPQL